MGGMVGRQLCAGVAGSGRLLLQVGTKLKARVPEDVFNQSRANPGNATISVFETCLSADVTPGKSSSS